MRWFGGGLVTTVGWGLALAPTHLVAGIGRAAVVAGGIMLAQALIDYAKEGR